MYCTVCGATLEADMDVCPVCGAAVPAQANQQPVQPAQQMGGYQQPVQPAQQMGGYQQPVQPMQQMGGYQQPVQPAQQMKGYQQPVQPMQQMGGYQQPVQPMQQMGGYQQPMGAFPNQVVGSDDKIMGIVSLVGAILLFIAPFLSWLTVKISMFGQTASESTNLFKLGGIYAIFGILMILISLVFIGFFVADYVPAISDIKQKVLSINYIELILAGVALACVIISAFNSDVKDAKDYAKTFGGDVTRGIGLVFAIIGVLAIATPRVLKLLGIKLFKKN